MTEGYIAGTIIKTPLGGTPIEQIAIGDDILSIHNNEIIVSKVTAIHKNINSIIQIQTAKNTLSGSVDHLIKTFNGYVPLKSLNIGDAVITHNLTTECELILNKKQLEAQTIYNLSVSNQHTNYSFLANNFIVHNKMYCEGTAKVYMNDSDGVQVADKVARCEFENCLTQSSCLEKLYKCCCDCEPYTIASAVVNSQSNPTWDLTPYQGPNISKYRPPQAKWRLVEVGSGGTYCNTYGEGKVAANRSLIGLPNKFTSTHPYNGYMKLIICCKNAKPPCEYNCSYPA